MESDESIDLVDSEAVNTQGSVFAKEEHENPCEHSEECEIVDPPRFHSYINFFFFKLKFAIFVKQEQGSVEVSRPCREACAGKSDRGCYLCKAGNKNCNVNCQCH